MRMSALEMCYDDAVTLAECHRALTLLNDMDSEGHTVSVVQEPIYRATRTAISTTRIKAL